MKTKFPTFAVILLVFAFLWLASDMKWIDVNVPWIPVVLIIASLGMILNRYRIG